MSRQLAFAVTVLLAICVAWPASGFAQEYALPYDADSPAAVEYALPLQAARVHAAPKDSPTGGAGGGAAATPGPSNLTASRFGEGVTKDNTRSSSSSATSPSARSSAHELQRADQRMAAVVSSSEDERLKLGGLIAGGVLVFVAIVLLGLRRARARQP